MRPTLLKLSSAGAGSRSAPHSTRGQREPRLSPRPFSVGGGLGSAEPRRGVAHDDLPQSERWPLQPDVAAGSTFCDESTKRAIQRLRPWRSCTGSRSSVPRIPVTGFLERRTSMRWRVHKLHDSGPALARIDAARGHLEPVLATKASWPPHAASRRQSLRVLLPGEEADLTS